MKYKCGCITRKILKSEIEDYPEGTDFILEEMCEEHKKQMEEEIKNN